jgi:hypothetical protein
LEADALVDDELSGWGEWHVESGLFGPDTPEQALQHGYLGREWWGGGAEPPKLVSSDPEFLAAADECGQEWDSALPVAGLYLEYSGDIGNRVSEAMYRAMQRNVEVEAAAVFNEWLGCIETAGFTPEGAGISFGFGIEAEGGGGMATYFGVEVGAWKDGRDPDTTPLPAGTTEIRQGGSRGVYVPTDAEVELAMVDVACKEEIRFWQRLYPMLMGIQREAMAAIQGELLQLNPEIEALAGRAQSLSEQRALVSELVGVWPPPIPAVEVPEGATWPCPPVEPKVDQVLDAADVPDEIRYLPAGDTYHVDAAWGVNYGPACRRSPALVAVDFDAEDRSSADAVVVVWVEAPDVFGHPPDPPGGMPRIEPHEEMAATVDVDGFVVRYHPATEWMTERVEMVGVIDGLPVWIQASGMTPEALSVVVRLMTASAATGEVRVTPPDNFEVVRSGPVVAEVIDNVVWFVEGIGGLSVQVQRAPGFDPYVSALGFTESFTFVDVGGRVGVLAREGGGTGSVMWAIQPGIFAMVQGDGTFEELIELAEQLTRAPTS